MMDTETAIKLRDESPKTALRMKRLDSFIPAANTSALQKIGKEIWERWNSIPFEGYDVLEISLVVKPASSDGVSGVPCLLHVTKATEGLTYTSYVGVPKDTARLLKYCGVCKLDESSGRETTIRDCNIHAYSVQGGSMVDMQKLIKKAQDF